MIDHGFAPDIPLEAQRQAEGVRSQPERAARPDRTALASIDNDDSRDLDQIEWAERAGAKIRVPGRPSPTLIPPSKGDARSTATRRRKPPRSTPRRAHFPDAAGAALHRSDIALGGGERASVVVEFAVAADGSFDSTASYRARVATTPS